MNIERITHNYFSLSQHDLDSAEVLLDEARYSHAVILLGRCVEKMLKGLWVLELNEHPPATKRLLLLAKRVSLDLDDQQVRLLAGLSVFAADYEDLAAWKRIRACITKDTAREYFHATEKWIEWIKPMLRR